MKVSSNWQKFGAKSQSPEGQSKEFRLDSFRNEEFCKIYGLWPTTDLDFNPSSSLPNNIVLKKSLNLSKPHFSSI